MAEPDLERLRSLFDRWAHGDFATPEYFHADLEVVLDWPERSTHHGLDGLRTAWYGFLEQWRDLRNVPEEFIVLDDGRILVLCRYLGEGKASGLPIDQPAAVLIEMRDGLVSFMQNFWHREQGREAAGISG